MIRATSHLVSTDADKFHKMITQRVKEMQDAGFVVEIQYQIVSNVDEVLYTAFLVGREK